MLVGKGENSSEEKRGNMKRVSWAKDVGMAKKKG